MNFTIMALSRILAKQWNGGLFPVRYNFMWIFHSRNLVKKDFSSVGKSFPECLLFYVLLQYLGPIIGSKTRHPMNVY